MQFDCPTCKTASLSVLYPAARDYITGQNFEVLSCASCSLGITAPQPSDMEPFYPAIYRRYSKPILILLKALYGYRVSNWTKLFSAPGRALEIGCGDGFMLASLQRAGWQVAGTERTDEMARHARQVFNIEMFIGGPENVPTDRTYDLVVLFQVLEHMSDPTAVLEDCARLLRPGGKIVIGVPNFASIQSRYAREDWFHLDVPRHLFHFTPSALKDALTAVGIAKTRARFFSPEHDPYGWMQSILNRAFANKNSLTRLLMRSRPLEKSDAVLALLVVLLAVPSVLLSLFSWAVGSGAIIEMVGEKE